MKLAEKLRKWIAERGITGVAIAREFGISSPRISEWKKGDGEPDRAQLVRLARLLDLPLAYLVDDAMDDPSEATDLSADQLRVLSEARRVGYITANEVLRALPDAGPTPYHLDRTTPGPAQRKKSV